jgi:hypothetical protein
MSRLTTALREMGWPKIMALTAILAVTVYRLTPHIPNFTPLGAMFVLGGLYLGRGVRWMLVPFAGLLISDVVLDLRWNGDVLEPDRLFEIAAFVLVALAGRWASGRAVGWKIAAVAATPFVFFLVSNFGVWLSNVAWTHSATAAAPCAPHGLAACYLDGLPFFRGTLIGDFLFGLAGLAAVELPRRLGAHRTATARA